MSLTPYVCTNCGFWQRYFATPPSCPVCSDVRNALPEDGWRFETPEQVAAYVGCTWRKVEPDVVMFSNTPAIGIAPCGYLLLRQEGNVAFEAAGWYSDQALDYIESLGGIRFLSASHPHAYGALWRLQDRFNPEVLIQRSDIPHTKAFRVTWPFDDGVELGSDLRLLHTGGHFDGHSVLYYAPRKALFVGDALKFDLGPDGRAVGVSCHKAFHNEIPLTHAEIRRYRQVIGSLDFEQAFTPFEHVPNGRREDAVRLYDAQLAARPFFGPIPVEGVGGRVTGVAEGAPVPSTSDPQPPTPVTLG